MVALTPALVALVAAIVFLAGVVQATTGFGFAVVGMPLITVFMSPRDAIIALTLISLALTVVVTARAPGDVAGGVFTRVALPSVAGIPLGLLVLALVPSSVLTVTIGLLVIVMAVVSYQNWVPRPSRSASGAAGLVSGVLMTSTGLNGPPLVLTFQALGMSPRALRGTLQAAFALQNIVAIVGFACLRDVKPALLVVAGVSLPFALVGWWAGGFLFRRFGAGTFRVAVLTMLLVSGGTAVVRGMYAL